MLYVRFNTQPPKGGWAGTVVTIGPVTPVSTHSRLKAAGISAYNFAIRCSSFNTQPPKGGW